MKITLILRLLCIMLLALAVYVLPPLSSRVLWPVFSFFIWFSLPQRDKNDKWDTQPDWSAHRDDTYGYLLLSAPSEKSLEMVYLSKSYNVHDQATIVRTQPIGNWTFTH